MPAPAEQLVRRCNDVIQTYEGRDKLARLFQFGGRAVMGLTSEATPAQARARRLNVAARQLMITLAGSRRCFRIGREVPVLLGLPRDLELPRLPDRALRLAEKAFLLAFLATDHWGWWKQVLGGMRSGFRTIQLGLKFLAMSTALAALSRAKALLELQLGDCAAESQQERAAQRRRHIVGLCRNGMMAVQAAHLSRWWLTGDSVCGVLGVASSAIDICQVWPA